MPLPVAVKKASIFVRTNSATSLSGSKMSVTGRRSSRQNGGYDPITSVSSSRSANILSHPCFLLDRGRWRRARRFGNDARLPGGFLLKSRSCAFDRLVQEHRDGIDIQVRRRSPSLAFPGTQLRYERLEVVYL